MAEPGEYCNDYCRRYSAGKRRVLSNFSRKREAKRGTIEAIESRFLFRLDLLLDWNLHVRQRDGGTLSGLHDKDVII
jgi:hypothetical protein